MVTSVFGMVLFSQGRQGHEFDEGRTGSRRADCAAIDGRIPRLVSYRERHKRRGIEFDDIRRCPSRVTEPLDNLNRPVRGYSHLDRFAGSDSAEFLQDEPHGDRCRVAIGRATSNQRDSGSAARGIDLGKGHAQHASSGKGRVFT